MDDKILILYGDAHYNPFTVLARDVLARYHINYQEINMEDSSESVQTPAWLESLALPTLAVLDGATREPVEAIEDLNGLQSFRGVDLGAIICSPNNQQLENWLFKHGFLSKPYKR